MDESISKKGNIAVRILKVFGWTLLTIVIVCGVLLVGAVMFLNSKDLSPTVEKIANEHIDGHVKSCKPKLGFHPHLPILGVEIDHLPIISHAFDSLSTGQR